jgi:N6-L-threonylcarbamoyladenine synthase/protein kinase Bud32
VNKEKILYQGAEAKIIQSTFFDKKVVKKHRIKKTYRIKEIDEVLIANRTKEEAKLIHVARKQGVCVPIIYDVDIKKGIIVMAYIKGKRIKEVFDKLRQEKRRDLCVLIGENIAKLHNKDIIHGDITTSNMILDDHKIFFIDFGLGEINNEVESRGVDLHVLMEAMESTHSQYANDFSYVLKGYENIYHGDIKQVKQKIKDIVKRGRYR